MFSMSEYLEIIFLKVYFCVFLGPNSLTVVNLDERAIRTQDERAQPERNKLQTKLKITQLVL